MQLARKDRMPLAVVAVIVITKKLKTKHDRAIMN